MQKVLLSVAVVCFLLSPIVIQAGTIYTTQSNFDVAVTSMTLSWSEDFEGFTIGSVAVPTVIGSGAAEISRAGTAEIILNTSTSIPASNEWLGVEGGVGETIQGIGGSSLGVNAFGFEYFSELAGNYVFHHSGGDDNGIFQPAYESMFIGWVGDPGEILNFVDYFPTTSAHIFDDFVAYTANPIPEPATMFLFGIGLLGFAGVSRKKK